MIDGVCMSAPETTFSSFCHTSNGSNIGTETDSESPSLPNKQVCKHVGPESMEEGADAAEWGAEGNDVHEENNGDHSCLVKIKSPVAGPDQGLQKGGVPHL